MSLFIRNPDPVFGLPTPILFAHRGGAKEVEESTRRGFAHAVRVGADVFELDVHVLKSGAQREFVVWHGPDLSNVLIDALRGSKASHPAEREDDENDIRKWDWQALKDNAWVAHPDQCVGDIAARDLSATPRTDDRKLLTLEDLLRFFPGHPINVELKASVGLGADIDQFVDILDHKAGGRKLLVVSLNPLLIDAFRLRSGDRYPTGFSVLGVLGSILVDKLIHDMHNHRALQTTYSAKLTKPDLIRKVHERRGAVHVFLTAFTKKVPAIDADDGRPTEEELFEILDRGVDGVMTDRPERVRGLIDAWLQRPVPSVG